MPPNGTPFTSKMGFASTDEEAATRYHDWRTTDPFEDVEPALLNSGDIADYVAATGMIHPFRPAARKLKSASYEVDLLGRCLTFTGPKQEDRHVTTIDKGDIFVLRRNEIAFVRLEPLFRLPDYMALRFNLKITHVYRGLLLGTGPLVDPGFNGYLWIPLHNLTANDYHLRGGEGLVWMEFTKVSPRFSPDKPDRQSHFQPFPEAKNKRKDVMDYIRVATRGQPDPTMSIVSSIPSLIQESSDKAKTAADAASSTAASAKRLTRNITFGGAIALLALLFSLASLLVSVQNRAEDALRKVEVVESRMEALTGDLQSPFPSPQPSTAPDATSTDRERTTPGTVTEP